MVVRKADRILIGSNSFLSRDATLLPVVREKRCLTRQKRLRERLRTNKQTNGLQELNRHFGLNTRERTAASRKNAIPKRMKGLSG